MKRAIASSGTLVLGMHRSGTSALSRVLGLCGADLGSRLLGAGKGNETGHWEDALAVEIHERLLSDLGRRWDDVAPLPEGWMQTEAARSAARQVAAYVADDRARHRHWVVKDPRLSLFAPLWVDAAAAAGLPIGVVVMARHPQEVAGSLAARDGIPPGQALLLWAEHTLAAVEIAAAHPHVVLGYEQVLADWRGCVQRIKALPGGKGLKAGPAVAREIDAFLDAGLRHQRGGEGDLPKAIERVWTVVQDAAAEGELAPASLANIRRALAPVRELLRPLVSEWRQSQRQLWERVGRAEAQLVQDAGTLPQEMRSLGDKVDQHHAGLVDILSGDIRRMQDATATALQAASAQEREAALARELAPRLQALEASLAPLSASLPAELGALTEGIEHNRAALVKAISQDLRRMQDTTAKALQAAAAHEGEDTLARQLAPRLQALEAALAPLSAQLPAELGALAEGIEHNRASLVKAISEDLRRMQETTASTLKAAAAQEREAALAREIAPRLQALEAAVVPLSASLPAELGALTEGIEQNRAALVQAISEDLRRMQETTAATLQAAAAQQSEVALARELAPRLQALEAAVVPLSASLPAELGALTEGIEHNRASLVKAISEDLRRMQDTTADAIRAAAAHEGEDSLARQLSPRLLALEAALAPLSAQLPAELGALTEGIAQNRDALVQAISEDLRRMQDTTAQALKAAAAHEGEDALARQLSPRLQALENTLARELASLSSALPAELGALTEGIEQNRVALVQAISEDLRRMQDTTAATLQAAAAQEREAALARELAPRLQALEAAVVPLSASLPAELGALTEGIEQNRAALVQAISEDLRRMQDTTADAIRAAAAHEGEDALARQLAPRLQALEAALAPLSAQLPAELGALAEGIEHNRASLVKAISEDLRRMQDTTAEALKAAAAHEGEDSLARRLAPRLESLENTLAPLAASLPAELGALTDGIAQNRNALVQAISEDLRRMQDTTAEALKAAAVHEGEDSLARRLSPRLDSLESTLAPLAANLPAELGALTEGIALNRNALVQAITEDLRRMQETTANALRAVAAQEGEAALARQLSPRLQALEDSLAPGLHALEASLSPRLQALETGLAPLPDRLGGLEKSGAAFQAAVSAELAQLRESSRVALEKALAGELRRAQDQVSAATARAARLEAENAALHGMAEKLETVIAERERLRAESQRLSGELMHLGKKLETIEHERSVDQAQLEEQLQRINELTAQLETAQRELAAGRHEIEQLRDLAQQLGMLKSSRSWRWTRPLRAVGRLLHGNWGGSDDAKVRRMMRDAVAHVPLISDKARAKLVEQTLSSDGHGNGGCPLEDLPSQDLAAVISLAPEQPGLPDVFVWSVIDWHFRIQRPQHLARALAEKGHRVFYISNNLVDSAEPGFRLDPIDASGRLFQVHLHLKGSPPIYFGMPSDEQVEALRGSLASLLGWTCTQASVSLVQHPYWSPLVRAVPNGRVVYDCMDHHGGFENNANAVLDAEARLVEDSDLVIVTSTWLEHEVGSKARAVAMVRNAGEYDFFSKRPDKVFRDEKGRKVIGYYGAIAEWFDLDLVRKIAVEHPEALVLLVGNDTAGAGAALADLPNVQLTGEVPYATLPYWLYGFDVCLLPFRVIPLTIATNPVKVYEYLSAGRPVVAVDVPEMGQFEGLVRVGKDADGFVRHVGEVLAAPCTEAEQDARRAFAAGQTWAHRAASLDEALATIQEPVVSVVVLTYNNLVYTEACLHSIEAYSDYRNLEVIVVDNASSDGSPEFLRRWAEEPSAAGHRRRLVLNDKNLGFAAGNNVGLAVATGDVLVMLNNDTYVTPGWVRGICNALRSQPGLGMVGPVTNNIGNEAKLDIAYADMVEMIHLAGEYTRKHPGALLPMRTVAFFCVAMPRIVYEKLGGLDEAFGVGFFEDDDYCRRVEEAGWKIACAESVFVHHHLSASFDQLKAEKKRELFERNKAIYEAKWGEWTPHVYRKRGS